MRKIKIIFSILLLACMILPAYNAGAAENTFECNIYKEKAEKLRKKAKKYSVDDWNGKQMEGGAVAFIASLHYEFFNICKNGFDPAEYCFKEYITPVIADLTHASKTDDKSLRILTGMRVKANLEGYKICEEENK